MIIYLRDEFPQSQRLMFSTVQSGSSNQEMAGQGSPNIHAVKYEDEGLAGTIPFYCFGQGFSQLLVSLHTDFSQTLLDDPELWDFTLDLMDQPPQSATTNPCNSDPGSDYRMSTCSKTPQRPAYLRTTVLPQGNEGFAQHRSHQCVPKFSGTGTLPWRCLYGTA